MLRNSKWVLSVCTGTALLIQSGSGVAQQTSGQPNAAPTRNLRLMSLTRAASDPSQAWVEANSIVRQGTNVEAWALQTFVTDQPTPSGPVAGQWLKLSIACQTRMVRLNLSASVRPDGRAEPVVAMPPAPPEVARPQTIGGRLVEVLCAAIPSGVPSTDRVALAIAATRNPRPASPPTQAGASKQGITQSQTGASAQRAAPVVMTITPASRRECRLRYEALGYVAMQRQVSGTMVHFVLSPDESEALESASKSYLERSFLVEPGVPPDRTLTEAKRRAEAYMAAPGHEKAPAKTSRLSELKVLAAECDRTFGYSAITLP